MAEAALSFLGLGVQPPTPSWGGMIADGRDLNLLRNAPWTSVFPGLAIGAAVLGFNLLGDALRDALDPRRIETAAPSCGRADARGRTVTDAMRELRAREFPWAIPGDQIFLNHASTGPLPQRAVDALHEATALRAQPWRYSQEMQFGALAKARAACARLIGASAERDRAHGEHVVRPQPRGARAAVRAR